MRGPSPRIRRPLAAAISLLVGATALAAPTPAEADSLRLRRPPSGFWVGFHGGLTLNSDIALDGSSGGETLNASDQVDGSFGISAYYRTARFDLGVLVDNTSGGMFAGDGSERCPAPSGLCPVGSRTRVAALLRWRYLDESWGSLFMRLSPGWVVVGHSDAVMARAARTLGWEVEDPADLVGVIDTHNGGFTFGIDFGFMIYLSKRVGLLVEIETITANTTMGEGEDEVSYDAYMTLLTVGIETAL